MKSAGSLWRWSIHTTVQHTRVREEGGPAAAATGLPLVFVLRSRRRRVDYQSVLEAVVDAMPRRPGQSSGRRRRLRIGRMDGRTPLCWAASWCEAATSISLVWRNSRVWVRTPQALYSGNDAVNRVCRKMALSSDCWARARTLWNMSDSQTFHTRRFDCVFLIRYFHICHIFVSTVFYVPYSAFYLAALIAV